MQHVLAEKFLENLTKLSSIYQEILKIATDNNFVKNFKLPNINQYQEISVNILQKITENPEKFSLLTFEYINEINSLISTSFSQFWQTDNNLNQANNEDNKKEKDIYWKQNLYFDFVKQYYSITSTYVKNLIDILGLDPYNYNIVKFYTNNLFDSLSPQNFILTNPEVIAKSLSSGLDNLVQGMSNFLEDLKKSGKYGEYFHISTTDSSKFKIGKNIAATEGKIIFQNDLMQLICYKPKKNTYQVPIFIIPPCINKYYILDLSNNNSLIKWLVDNNFQVFLISWVNPTEKYRNIDFEDYLKLGILEPLKYLEKIGFNKVNAVGYCIGGTMLASILSYLQKNKQNNVNSASFLTSLFDFSNPGEIGAFINKNTIPYIEENIKKTGYLDGKYLSNSFSLIRANDLIWSYFVNNYLLGNKPSAFDILYWNSDSTNLPAKMYKYYINNMYLKNMLIKSNKLKMLDTNIDLSEINTPTFSLAAKADHIAIWNAVYDGYKLLKGDKTFCLTDAGHVAGIVNPADNKKYSYYINKKIDNLADEWLLNAEKIQGSWWNYWKKWLINHNKKLEKSINYENLPFIEKAPGSYVQRKI